MSTSRDEILKTLKTLLRPEQFKDYCPNGMQVEGKPQVQRLVTGVTACQALIDRAIEADADMLLVHHGYFWRGEDETITGIKKTRIEALLKHNISLLAYHLPLDVHGELGNNATLGRLLGFKTTGDLGKQSNNSIGLTGELETPLSGEGLGVLLEARLGRPALHIPGKANPIRTVAWCTGAAQNFIDLGSL